MNLIYGVIPTLVILAVIIISNPFEVEAQALESDYVMDFYFIFNEVDIQSAIDVRNALQNKAETYPLRVYLLDWDYSIEEHNGTNLVQLKSSFSFVNKSDAILYWDWVKDNIPQPVLNKIIYAKVMVLDNTHHYPNDDILPDVIIFENTIGSLTDANFEY